MTEASWSVEAIKSSQWKWWQLRELILTLIDIALILVVAAIYLGLGALMVTGSIPLGPIELFAGNDSISTVFWSGILAVCFLVYRFSVYWVHDPLWPPKRSQVMLSHHASRDVIRLLQTVPAPITLDGIWLQILRTPAGMLAAVRSELAIREFQDALSATPTQAEESAGPWAEEDAQRIIIGAARHAASTHQGKMTISDVLWALADDDHSAKRLEKFPGAMTALRLTIDREALLENLRRRNRHFRQMAHWHPRGPMNISMTSTATPLLDSVSIDLTAQAIASGFQPLMGRTKELQELFAQLDGHERQLLLVGWPGVGKTSFLQELAQCMVEEVVPPVLFDRRLLSIEPSRLIAGATKPGEVEYRLQRLLFEISKSRNIVLVLEQIEQFTGLGTNGVQLDVLDQLIRIVDQSSLVVIATTTPDQFQKQLELKTNFTTVFHRFDLAEMSPEGTLEALSVHAAVLEQRDRVLITTPALQEIVDGAARVIHDQFFPAKAVLALDHVIGGLPRAQSGMAVCTKKIVDTTLGEMTHVPIGAATGAERDMLLHFETLVRQSVVGQSHAIDRIANALRRARVEVDKRSRPIGNFLFVGPTGVGKTHLAKTVASTLFGSSMHLVRLDMSEFQAANSVEQFIGTPGSGHGGVVTEQLRQNPYSLLLLDELEKASPKILTLLLQLMDEGRITDVTGRTIDATNLLVIATSNIATPFITRAFASGQTVDQVHHTLVEQELPALLPPELINRFDDVIVFEPLKKEDIESIAQLELGHLQAALKRKGIEVDFSPATVAWISQLGFDPQYGARPLKRAIADNIQDPLSQGMLKGEIIAGSHIRMEPGARWSAV
ncbi:ATP-dependent Clp protease ATP-binding subunit [Candidatus Uhrbacteria bacterium]|nr:ATP-dependent Clp protease ATP-binding subunit [Candidatus Uhrbacteria bacterium]